MEYGEDYPCRIDIYDRLGPITVGYRRVRSLGDVNHSFPQRRRYDTITGCRAFSLDLRAVRWLARFRLANMEKFDRTQNPIEFLQIYTTAVLATRGGEHVMANYLPIVLKDSVRSWHSTSHPS